MIRCKRINPGGAGWFPEFVCLPMTNLPWHGSLCPSMCGKSNLQVELHLLPSCLRRQRMHLPMSGHSAAVRDICFLHIRHIRSSSLRSSVRLFRRLSGCRGWHRYILGWANLFRLHHLHAASTGRGNAYPDSSHTRQGYIRTFCAIRRILSSRICGNGLLLAVHLSAVSRNLLFPRALRRHLPGGSSRSRNRLRRQLPASLLFVSSSSGNRALAEKR